MKTIHNLFKCLPLAGGLLFANICFGQTTILSESMGSVSGTTSIASHESANGFDNDALTMTGTADVRNTQSSSGQYTGASGGANIFITNTSGKDFQIEGLNTTGFPGLKLSFGVYKSTGAGNGSDLVVEVSSDGTNYTPLNFILPEGSGDGSTSDWYLVTAAGNIPATANLRIRFTQTATTTQFRVDDVTLVGTSCDAEITPGSSLTFCEGGNVQLTANSGSSYLWSTGATTQSITVSASGTYSVQVSDGMGCTATSDPVDVVVNLAPSFTTVASEDTICPGDTVTLTAQMFTSDLIISEYVEGSGNEKYIEIFNGTGATVNLSNYNYRAFHNGSSTATYDFALSGSLTHGSVLVLKNTSATLYGGTATADNRIAHNGDDAVAIYNTVSGQYADIFGVIGHDPGNLWNSKSGHETGDRTLRRRDFVKTGISVNPNLPGTFGFISLGTEWDEFAIDEVSGLGSHNLTCSYSWSPATTPSSGCVVEAAPSSTTTYTATATYDNGCTSSSTVTVTVVSCEGRSADVTNNSPSETAVAVYPNPFNDVTTINFNVSADNKVLVDIIDINGKPVANLYNGQMNAGDYRVQWNGTNGSGGRMSQGIYICRVMIGSEMTVVRLLLQ